MPRIPTVAPGETDATSAHTLAGVQAKLGMVPNVLATLAQSSVALKGYVALTNALAGGRLTARHREIVAVAVAQVNRCEYCLAAHTALGKGAGLSDAEIHSARSGTGTDVRDNAVSALASTLVRQRGALSDEDLATVRAAGLDDGLIMEIVANVALNTLTNYTNNLARTEVDFPPVAIDFDESPESSLSTCQV